MRAAARCLALFGAMAFGSSLAQTVYRCGQSYSHEPCPQGRAIDVQDARTEAQRAEAQAAQQRQGLVADELAERRVRQEASAPTRRRRHQRTPNRWHRTSPRTSQVKQAEVFATRGLRSSGAGLGSPEEKAELSASPLTGLRSADRLPGFFVGRCRTAFIGRPGRPCRSPVLGPRAVPCPRCGLD